MDTISSTPIPVLRTLKKLGQDLRDARRKRRIPMQLAADRAGISRATLSKIEKGEQGVSIGAYARVLFILGLNEHLAKIADPVADKLGLGLEIEHLPQRIRMPRKDKG